MLDRDRYLELLTRGLHALTGILRAVPSEAAALADWERFERELHADANPLSTLGRRFGLDRLSLQCVLLTLVRHLEPEAADGFDPNMITVSTILELLCDEHERTHAAHRLLSPSSPLVRNRIISTSTGLTGGSLARQVVMTRAALGYLLAEPDLVDEVAGIARLVSPSVSLLNVIVDQERLDYVRSLMEHHSRYRSLLTDWRFDDVLPYGRGLSLLVAGPSGTGKSLLALALGSHVGRPLVTLSAADVPDLREGEAVLRTVFAEATIRDAIVVIDHCEALLGRADPRRASATRAIEDFDGVTILITTQPDLLDRSVERLVGYNLRLDLPSATQRRQIWEAHIPPAMPLAPDVELDTLANDFDLTGAGIKNALLVAVHREIERSRGGPVVVTMERLLEGCRSQLGYALEELTVRSSTSLTLDDVVLPQEPAKRVREIIGAIRNQSTVLNRWHLGDRLTTGLGITALFDGPPGTGKTLCAEVIASTFGRTLHRVNIPEVVSKWVGETEKHIREIFQGARVGHAMLLFDEADSLFASRTAEARTATERYANMEVNLLLQEIERFPGVCFLTTNSFGALDNALLRRIQFRVTFEEPDAAQRLQIWQVLRPDQLPCAPDVDWRAIADTFELTGGRIKNALVRAAYRAADLGGPLTHAILQEACRDEYAAEGRVVREGHVGRRSTAKARLD